MFIHPYLVNVYWAGWHEYSLLDWFTYPLGAKSFPNGYRFLRSDFWWERSKGYIPNPESIFWRCWKVPFIPSWGENGKTSRHMVYAFQRNSLQYGPRGPIFSSMGYSCKVFILREFHYRFFRILLLNRVDRNFLAIGLIFKFIGWNSQLFKL